VGKGGGAYPRGRRRARAAVVARGFGPRLSGGHARRGNGRRQIGAVSFGHGAVAGRHVMARAHARPCQPGATRGTPGGGSALTSGPDVEGERLTGGTLWQILF
jgi:hypothetical protein